MYAHSSNTNLNNLTVDRNTISKNSVFLPVSSAHETHKTKLNLTLRSAEQPHAWMHNVYTMKHNSNAKVISKFGCLF